jgi:DNA repair exonuclease SbcCD ATPase subunit
MSEILEEAEEGYKLYEKDDPYIPRLVAEIKRLQSCCEKYGEKVMRQETNMLKVIARNREQRKQLAAKDIELNNALSDLKHEKERVEIMHLRRENELRQMNELGTQNKDLMANCNQLRDRCWKAEGELARWQKNAIEEKAKQMSGPCDFRTEYEWCDSRQASCDGFPHMWECCPNQDHWLSIAAKELNLQVTQEAEYAERLSDAFLKLYEMQLPTMDPETRKRHAQAALAKIREGK